MPTTNRSIHGEWSSRLAFILAASGSAVGLGNIWKFPYMTGEKRRRCICINLSALYCPVLVLPVMMAEVMLGRRRAPEPY